MEFVAGDTFSRVKTLNVSGIPYLSIDLHYFKQKLIECHDNCENEATIDDYQGRLKMELTDTPSPGLSRLEAYNRRGYHIQELVARLRPFGRRGLAWPCENNTFFADIEIKDKTGLIVYIQMIASPSIMEMV